MKENAYKMKLVLGDWSDDGHGKSEEFVLDTNKPVKEIQDAYKASCKLTGLSFNHNEDYTGRKFSWEEREKYYICTNYEKASPSEESRLILKYFGIDYPEEDASHEDFVHLWLDFVKLSLPDLNAEIDPGEKIPYINGYWNDNLNVQFGYGLFY